MSKQPKTTEAKRLKLHHRAMQVIPEWMSDWGFDSPARRCKGSHDKAGLMDLDARLKTAFQQDEQIRADLLAACEQLVRVLEGNDKMIPSLFLAVYASAQEGIAKAKEANHA